MHRPTVGFIAAFALLGWLVLWVRPTEMKDASNIQGGLLKMGLLLGAIWLALPQIRQVPGWVVKAVAIALVIVAIRPNTLVFAVPILATYLALRSKLLPWLFGLGVVDEKGRLVPMQESPRRQTPDKRSSPGAQESRTAPSNTENRSGDPG